MLSINAAGLDTKSGGAQWRDLCVDALSWRSFSREESWALGPPKGMKIGCPILGAFCEGWDKQVAREGAG